MRPIRVWAPHAGRVEVVTATRRTAMEAGPGGWFTAAATAAGQDGRYLLSVDGGEPRPDPRSPYQPLGVHGPSELVDHDAFAWSDATWRGMPLKDAVIYELHTGTFTPEGTFDGVASRLPHLAELGVTAIELMPVATFAGTRGWGYDGVDIYAPHPAYGGPGGLKRLVDACHTAGIAVVMDVVYNHLGPDGNYLGEFGPYFTQAYQTPWGAALNFDDRDSDEVRRFFVDNALAWARDYHLDGLRLDAVQAIIDTSAVHFLEQVATAVHDLAAEQRREVWVIAESDLNDPRLVTEAGRGGFGLDAQWSDDFHHALHAVITGETNGYYADFGRLEDLACALRQAYVYGGRYSEYRGRTFGRLPVEISPRRFLGYIQDHDQVGNRARGERISSLVSPGLCKVAAAVVLTSPFVPMLFAGEEWGAASPFLYFTDHQQEELARAVSRGRRREFAAFGWPPDQVPDPQLPGTFEASRLDWTELDREPHRGMLRWYRDLLRLRASEPALRSADWSELDVDFDEERRWLTLRRGDIAVYCNFSQERNAIRGTGELLLGSSEDIAPSQAETRLPPESVAVLRVS